MRRYVVDLAISADELLRYYRGAASSVVASDRGGRRVQFPAAALRPFVSASGVRGTFVLTVTAENRLQSLERLPNRPSR